MEILGLIAKVLFIVLWPVLLMVVYYLFDKEGFKKNWLKIKQDIFKK